MLAGVYDRRTPIGRAEAERLVGAAFPRVDAQAHVAGPLLVVSDRMAAADSGRPARAAIEGSIYNDRELLAELGAPENLSPDALIALAYERWGDAMLDRFRGGFALAAWDERADRVLLAQDQVAIGAMFVHRVDSRLTFASEIHDLLALLPTTPPPDEVALVRWLAFEYHYDGMTMYQGVRRLGAGHCLTITDGQIGERHYWKPRYEPAYEGSHLQMAARLKDALVRSVDLRIRDVDSVGITLSGGFDSSTVAGAAALAKRPDQTLNGYSTVFPDDPGMDDSDMLDALVAELPLVNSRYRVEPGGTAAMSLMYLRDWRLPMSGPGWIVERPFMEQAATDGVQVMLDGQGGDELYGIGIYLVADRIRAGRLLSAAELIRYGIPVARSGLPMRQTLSLMTQFGFRAAVPHGFYRWLRQRRDPRRHAPKLLSEHSVDLFVGFEDELRFARSNDGPLWWLYMRQLLTEDREATGLGDFTRQRANWVGIEGRPPLFDVDLIETVLRLPPHLGFDGYLNRPLARQAMAGVLPDAVRLSPRKSNLAPFYFEALSGRDLPAVRALLAGDQLEIGRWIRRDFFRDLLDHPPAAKTRDWYQWLNAVWAGMTGELWLRSLADPGFAERMLEQVELPRLAPTRIR